VVNPPDLYPGFRGSQWVQKAWESEKYALAQQRLGKGPKLGGTLKSHRSIAWGERGDFFFGSRLVEL